MAAQKVFTFAVPPRPANRHNPKLPLSGLGSGSAKNLELEQFHYSQYERGGWLSTRKKSFPYFQTVYSPKGYKVRKEIECIYTVPADDRSERIALRGSTQASQPAQSKVASVWPGQWIRETHLPCFNYNYTTKDQPPVPPNRTG